MTAQTAPVPPAGRDPALDRACRLLARSQGNADLHAMIRLAARLRRAARRFLAAHPAGCGCDFCRGLGRLYAASAREDVAGLRWLTGLAIAPLEGLVVAARRDRPAPPADPAGGADEPTAVIVTRS